MIDERAAFEAWAEPLGINLKQSRRTPGMYEGMDTNYIWEGWQARAAAPAADQGEWLEQGGALIARLSAAAYVLALATDRQREAARRNCYEAEDALRAHLASRPAGGDTTDILPTHGEWIVEWFEKAEMLLNTIKPKYEIPEESDQLDARTALLAHMVEGINKAASQPANERKPFGVDADPEDSRC